MSTITHIATDRRNNDSRNSDSQNRNAPTRRQHRERDFGVGYGNSSGYALSKRYTSDWGQPRFRCA